MFYKIKKMILGLLAIASLLLIAGCQASTQQGPKAPQDLTKDQQGTWLWTDQQMTLQKVFLATNVDPRAAAFMIDDLDNVKMTMTIKDKTVELKYRFDYLKIYEDQYKGQNLQTPDFKTYVQKKTEDLKAYVATLQHTKITVDEANYAYDYTLTGTIDPDNHTITFPETPTFLSRIIFGPTSNPLEAMTYNYTVEGKQMTLSAVGENDKGLKLVMRLRFNYTDEKE
jgi:hypothetical protein